MDITFGMMFEQMAGIFLLLFIGYVLKRYFILPDEAGTVLSQVTTKLFLPALIFYTFMEECTVANLQEYGSWMFIGAVFQAIGIALGIVLSKWLAKGDELLSGIIRYVIAFPNTGAVGTPVVLALFGHLGLFQYQLFTLSATITCYGWGVAQLAPPQYRHTPKDQWKQIVTPVNVAMALGGVFGLTGIGSRLPQIVHTTIQNIGACYSVVAIIVAGFIIGKYHLFKLLRDKMAYLISIIRLVIIPIAFLLALRLLKVPDMLLTLACLTFACPCGVNSIVYPVSYGQDAYAGASLVLITSVLSVFTIPLLFVII